MKFIFILFCGAFAFGVAEAKFDRVADEEYVSGLIEDGLFDAALARLKSRPLENDEQAAQAFVSMAKIYSSLGNPAGARQALKEAEALDGLNTKILIEQARVEMVAGNLPRARSALEEAKSVKSLPSVDRIEISLIESRIELALGREGNARKVLNRVTGNERLVVEESKILLEQGDLPAAKSVLITFLKTNPGSGRGLTMMARIAEIGNDRTAAESFYRQALAQFVKVKDAPREESAIKALAKFKEQPRVRAPEPPPPKLADPPPELINPRIPPPTRAEPNPWILQDKEVSSPAHPASPTIIARAFPYPPDARLYTGSGVVVDGGKRVVTNRHVIENATNFYVRNSLGDLSAAKVERVSKTDDLAVLLLATPFSNERAVTASQFGEARAGATIAVIGFPLTSVLGSMTPSITNGIVIKTTGMGDSPDSFQVSAKMNKGNSGGAVFDTSGRVIGIAVGKLDTVKMLQGSGFLPEDINFAIHAERLKVVGLTVAPGQKSQREMSLEELYRHSIGSVVLVAGESK